MAADGSLVHALTLETGLNLSQQGFLAPKESFFSEVFSLAGSGLTVLTSASRQQHAMSQGSNIRVKL